MWNWGVCTVTDEVTKIDIVELDGKLERMADGIENILLCQSRMSEDVSKIKDAIYNPEEGLYARIRALELWKTQTAKIGWIIITSIIGLGCATVWHTFFK